MNISACLKFGAWDFGSLEETKRDPGDFYDRPARLYFDY
jgi:hypothetical protein